MLVDTDTHAVAIQGELDGLRVIVTIEGGSQLRQLKGKSFVAIKPIVVVVDDRAWDTIIGNSVVIHGGGELRVRDDMLDQALEDIESEDPDSDHSAVLIPLEIHDPHFPPAGVLVAAGVLEVSFNEIEPGTGPHNKLGLSACDGGRHSKREKCSCLRCFHDWWKVRAEEMGNHENA